MDLEERNKLLCQSFADGETMTSISRRTGISCTHLSRIFREKGIKRKKYELDKEYFETHSALTRREISEQTGVPLKRVSHLWKIAFGRKLTKGRTDFSNDIPQVDRNLLKDRVWLYEKYVDAGLGTPTIAKLLAVKTSKVVKALRDAGIPLRTICGAARHQTKRPDRQWLERHYRDLKWSISRCAKEYKTNFDAIYSALRGFGIQTRNSSEQHIGELNEFYGQRHDEQISDYCRFIGEQGKEWWLVGDVEEKIKQATEHAKMIWADPQRREECSRRTAELCRRGACNSKQLLYIRKDGKPFLLRSTWEKDVAAFLDSCRLIVEWDYEALSVPYFDDEIFRNFNIDFQVKWADGLTTYIETKNDHLQNKAQEQMKLASAVAFLRKNRSNLVIMGNADVDALRKGKTIPIMWVIGNRYRIDKSYLNAGSLAQEVLRHELTSKLCGWQPLQYSIEELQEDIQRTCDEDISLYWYKDKWRSTVPCSLGMPGRKLVLHHQPHFLTISSGNRKPLSEGFEDPWVIYRCLLQSMEEHESLSLERLLREMFFHFSNYSRTSHFAPGFARAIIKHFQCSGKKIFDPCCGWGGRMLGAWIEKCEYSGCELSAQSVMGLEKIAKLIGVRCGVLHSSCLKTQWPQADLILTSPPFYDVEHYLGDDQPWHIFKNRQDWRIGFVSPLVKKIEEHMLKYNSMCALYLDAETRDDFILFKVFDEVMPVDNKRHGRQKRGEEFICVYK